MEDKIWKFLKTFKPSEYSTISNIFCEDNDYWEKLAQKNFSFPLKPFGGTNFNTFTLVSKALHEDYEAAINLLKRCIEINDKDLFLRIMNKFYIEKTFRDISKYYREIFLKLLNLYDFAIEYNPNFLSTITNAIDDYFESGVTLNRYFYILRESKGFNKGEFRYLDDFNVKDYNNMDYVLDLAIMLGDVETAEYIMKNYPYYSSYSWSAFEHGDEEIVKYFYFNHPEEFKDANLITEMLKHFIVEVNVIAIELVKKYSGEYINYEDLYLYSLEINPKLAYLFEQTSTTSSKTSTRRFR